MWFKTVGGQQFMNGTLPNLIRTIETLANNIGRLAMNAERKDRLAIGGDLDYLRKLVFDYGPDAKVGDVAAQEMERLKNEAALKMEATATEINAAFDKLENVLDDDVPGS